MKKGILSLGTTVLVLIIAIGVALGGMFGYMLTYLDSGKIENRFEFVNVLNLPYVLSDVLLNLKIDDRLFLEHSIEAVVTGSLDNSKSDIEKLKLFLNKYDLVGYGVSIENNKNDVIFGIDKKPKVCGEDDWGFCVRTLSPQFGHCGVGRIEIEDKNNVCNPPDSWRNPEVCCKEDISSYEALTPDDVSYELFDVNYCAQNGVCTAPLRHSGPGFTDEDCGEGRVYIQDGTDDCKDTNEGKTPVCCVMLGEIPDSKYKGTAELPLLFKGKTLYEPKTYFCQDKNEPCENGAYVSGLCEGPPNIKCCVNEPIHCKPPHDAAYCIDTINYQCDDIIPDSSGDSLCPGQANVVCCDITDEEWNDIKGVSSSAEPKALCTMEGSAYNSAQPLGKLRVTISER